MRVVLISTVDCKGGASRAAFRLHRGLGSRSAMLVQRKVSDDAFVVESPSPVRGSVTFWRWLQEEAIDHNRAGEWNTHFSLGYPGIDLTQHPLIQQADVINLHWVAGFQSVCDIARLRALGRPVVWTLHDQRAFTGGCHFAFGCRGFESGCKACPQLQPDSHALPAALLEDAQHLLPAARLTVVTPSRWLGEEARRSTLFRTSRIETIPYGLESDVFKPLPKVEARQDLGIPPETLCLLFGADYGTERRKDFRELVEALQICSRDASFRRRSELGQVLLLCFGHPAGELASLPLPVRALGYVRDESALARIYAAADLFLLPSLADNLPCTLLEAMSCGTPAVAFAVGGIPELVEDGVTGCLAPVGDSARFGQILLELAATPDQRLTMSAAARARIEARHTLAAQPPRYARLFGELLAEPCGATKLPRTQVPDCGPKLSSLLPTLMRRAAERRSASEPQSARWRWLARRTAEAIGPESDAAEFAGRMERLLNLTTGARWRRQWVDVKKLLGFD